MTPAARVQSAIEILDEIQAGKPAEQALTGWARRSRFAGSKDRAAIRDHVFGVLRNRRSFAAFGGGESGRALMLGALRAAGTDPQEVFTGLPHAPAALTAQEQDAGRTELDPAEQADLPEWLWARFQSSLGDKALACAQALRQRAPVHLRVNARRAQVPQVIGQLKEQGISAVAHAAAAQALEVVEGERKIRNSALYTDGVIELQDAGSQAIVEALPLSSGMKVLDYCAGGGGKSLAMAALSDLHLYAHDAFPQRMRDLPARAKRAQVRVTLTEQEALPQAGPFDLILCDVPCSGSGSWRRAPEGKWLLTQERLEEIQQIQSDILSHVRQFLKPGGVLAYATCSVLASENEEQVKAALARHDDLSLLNTYHWLPEDGTDGFFLAILSKS
jgi:16S rRNA (cytosine967-C5)-methyltransferase